MSSDFEKQVNESLENGINTFINGLIKYGGMFFKGVFFGCKKLKNKYFLIGFLVSFIIPIVVRLKNKLFFTDTKWYIKIIYFVLLISPLMYLFVISKFKEKVDKDIQEFDEAFRKIGLIDVENNVPRLIKKELDEITGTDEYYFKSIIPLDEWKKKSSLIETTLDKSIFNIAYGESKQIIVINALNGDINIKEKLLWNDEYTKQKDGVLVLGKTATQEVSFNLNKNPHALIAGQTGSGKSVVLRLLLWQMLMQKSKIYMVDLKGGVEFGYEYEEVGEVIIEAKRAEEVLSKLVEENRRRLALLRENRVKNIVEYNNKFACENGKLQRIGMFMDEMGELMDKTGVDNDTAEILTKIQGHLSSLARLSRATGINLFLGVQRPDHKIITGQIKNNVPIRICGAFPDGSASEIVLGNTRAKDLKNIPGRMLFRAGAGTVEFQSYYFDDEKHFEVEKLDLDSINEKKNEETKQKEFKEEIVNDKNIEKKEEVKNETEVKAKESDNINTETKKDNQVKKVKAINMLKNSDI